MGFDVKEFWDKRVKEHGIKATGIKSPILHEYSQFLKWNIFKKEYRKFKKKYPEKDAKILDVGCGYGYWTMKFARDGFDVTGIDISEETIKNAKILADQNNLHINYFALPANEINFKDKFDLAISVAALQHEIDDKKWEEALEKIHHSLRKGGKLIMIESAPIFSKRQKAAWKAERTYKFHKKTAKEVGFRFVKSYGFVFNGYYLFYLLEKIMPKKIKKPIQRLNLKIFKRCDLFLSKIPFLRYMYYSKMLVFKK